MARGGLKFMRGAITDYVTYFLDAEGKGCVDHGYYGSGSLWNASGAGLLQETVLTPESYTRWLAGVDPTTGELRGGKVTEGELRTGVRAYEFGVNVPKSASIVAALNPELGRALMRAQERAAIAGIEIVRRAARVRVVQPGESSQSYVGVDSLEVAVFAHDGSREGDPHHHLHVQVGSKVFVDGKWRALAGRHMVGVIKEWQATVSASIATDPEWVGACAKHGLRVGVDGGIDNVSEDIEKLFSKRNIAIEAKLEELRQEFIGANKRAPSAKESVFLDQKAWSLTRPKKGERELLGTQDIIRTLRAAGANALADQITGKPTRARASELDINAASREAFTLAVAREVLSEKQLRVIVVEGINTAGGACDDLAAATARVLASVKKHCTMVEVPGGENAWVTHEVLASAMSVREHLAGARAGATAQTAALRAVDVSGLTPGQRSAAEAVAAGLPVVIEGAAGTGKTHALRRALDARNTVGLRTIAVAPSAAAVQQLGEGWTKACTAHSLLLEGGWTWNPESGLWREPTGSPRDEVLVDAALIVDEAAMMDLHTMSALARHATRHGARMILVGDDRQLAAIGVAGGFTLAAMDTDPVRLTEAKRFTDPNHADLAHAWRSSEDIDAVINQVMASGVIKVHASESDAHVALAEIAATSRNAIVMAADNASAKTINTLTRHEKEHAGIVGAKAGSFGRLNEPMGVGDVVQTRRNDNRIGVINRQRWIIDGINPDGGMRVHRADKPSISKTLDTEYVKEHVHRADVVTVHAAQGATAEAGHALIDDTWTREQAYVALTRGKNANVLHVVADGDDHVRETLRGVLSSSDRVRSDALTKLVTRRILEQRTDTTPTLAERITKALRIDRPHVGAWGSASAIGSALEADTSIPPRKRAVPQPPTR